MSQITLAAKVSMQMAVFYGIIFFDSILSDYHANTSGPFPTLSPSAAPTLVPTVEPTSSSPTKFPTLSPPTDVSSYD